MALARLSSLTQEEMETKLDSMLKLARTGATLREVLGTNLLPMLVILYHRLD
jgi:hypothetical protein